MTTTPTSIGFNLPLTIMVRVGINWIGKGGEIDYGAEGGGETLAPHPNDDDDLVTMIMI